MGVNWSAAGVEGPEEARIVAVGVGYRLETGRVGRIPELEVGWVAVEGWVEARCYRIGRTTHEVVNSQFCRALSTFCSSSAETMR